MICTEEAARNKWCSFVSISTGSIGTSDNRNFKCIASEYMSWNWSDGVISKQIGHCGRNYK